MVKWRSTLLSTALGLMLGCASVSDSPRPEPHAQYPSWDGHSTPSCCMPALMRGIMVSSAMQNARLAFRRLTPTITLMLED